MSLSFSSGKSASVLNPIQTTACQSCRLQTVPSHSSSIDWLLPLRIQGVTKQRDRPVFSYFLKSSSAFRKPWESFSMQALVLRPVRRESSHFASQQNEVPPNPIQRSHRPIPFPSPASLLFSQRYSSRAAPPESQTAAAKNPIWDLSRYQYGQSSFFAAKKSSWTTFNFLKIGSKDRSSFEASSEKQILGSPRTPFTVFLSSLCHISHPNLLRLQ